MALDLKGLVRYADGAALPGAGNKRLGNYHYATADTLATVRGAGYFNGAAAILNVGDVMDVTAGIGGTVTHNTFVVSANTGSVVTITRTDLTA